MEDQVDKFANLFNTLSVWVISEGIVVIILAWVLFKTIEKVLPVVAERLPAGLRQGTLNAIPITRVLLIIGVIVWLVPLIFNVTLQNFVLIAGALSVAIGFALKDLASAVIAGLVALFEKPYRLGDWVRVGENYGEVITVGMRAFQLRTPDDNIVTIPHDRIWTHNIINGNDGDSTLMCVADFFVARGQPTEGVAERLRDVARTSQFLNLDRAIIVVAKNTPVGITYQVKAYPFEPRDQFAFITDLTERGNAMLLAKGVETTEFPSELAV